MAVSQFGEPRGIKGWVAAKVVARLTGDANRWMVDCLELGPDDRFIDLGCGPGLALSYAAELAPVRVVGVDASETMVRQARRRNGLAVRRGQVEVRHADAARLPYGDGEFTKAGSLNSLQFWPSPGEGLREVCRVLVPGGRVAVVLMARSDDATGPGTPPWVRHTGDLMAAAGFVDLAVPSRTFGGVLHHALLGKKSGAPLDPTADGVRRGAGS